MYKVLLVDDELPALRLLQVVMKKHAGAFEVAESFQSSVDALAYLQSHSADLLITDISMDDMNGIELAKMARELYPNIRIIIVTGYADFEYAQGAIQAAVDDYILKPVSISHIDEILHKLKMKMDTANTARIPAALSALFSGQPYDAELIDRLYGEKAYYFALVRWGNLGLSQGPLMSTSPLPLQGTELCALYGRDEDEQLLFMPASCSAVTFQATVKSYVMQTKIAPTWTILFARSAKPFTEMPEFFRRSAGVMEQTIVIGRHHYAFLSAEMPAKDFSRHLSGAVLKRMEQHLLAGNMRMLKDLFISLAADWDKKQLPQYYASNMVHQLILFLFSVRTVPSDKQDILLDQTRELIHYASSYGDLMAGLYSILFSNSSSRDKHMSTEEMYMQALTYIHEKYSQPISIQTICSEIGISQTYLSRLFRKHGNTTYIDYLTQYRIAKAQQLIAQQPSVSLREIASCVGYDDYAYFSRVFHRVVGCSPSQWVGRITEK